MNWYELLFYKYIKGAQGQPKLRIMMPVFKGGTEQILPENGSTPTTAPIIADIRYPDALRTDQSFFYRESPTQESGNARLRRIKGNTLGWNQLIQNGNFANSSSWVGQSATVSISNGVANVTLPAKGNYVALRQNYTGISKTGHKYFVTATIKSAKKTAVGFYLDGQYAYQGGYDVQANTLTTVYSLIDGGSSGGFNVYVSRKNELEIGDVVQVSNVMLIDLTQMYGSGNEPTADEFLSLFSLPYYDYNQGELLPFMGTGIKTTGKNLLKNVATSTTVNGITYTVNEDGSITINGTATSNASLQMNDNVKLPKGTFKAVCNGNKIFGAEVWWFVYNFTQAKDMASQQTGGVFEYNGNDTLSFRMFVRVGNTINNLTIYPMIIFNGTDETFEPYTEITTDLPISNYFPTGMKSAGSVYDELTPRKAEIKVGAVDLGTLNWVYKSSYGMYTAGLVDVIKKPSTAQTKANVLCASRTTATWSQVFNGGKESGLCGVADTGHFGYSTTETDPSAFKTAMSGVYLYYELATPTETPIEPASDANEALSLLMGKSVSSNNAKQMIDIITKGE